MLTEAERDAMLVAEALTAYESDKEIKRTCELFGISRYEYMHEYCLRRYRKMYYTVTTTADTSGART